MLEVLNPTYTGKFKFSLVTPRKICPNREVERAACKKAETIAFGSFDTLNDALRASVMFVYAVAYFKNNPDVLKEPLFIGKNFKEIFKPEDKHGR